MKIEVISKIPIPLTKKHVCSFLGHVGYYHHFIYLFIIKIASPLFTFFSKYIEFSWTNQCHIAFEDLKEKLIVAPILRDQIGLSPSTFL